MQLTRIALKAGRYEGHLETNGAAPPIIELVHLDRVVGHAEISVTDGAHMVTAEMPAAVLSDGVQVVALRSAADGAVLDRVSFLMGSGLDDDFRGELALLREELELLKRAFRRHCTETGAE